MPNLEDFSSLAQLGAGIGLALSVFVEPLRIKERRVLRRLEQDLMTIADKNRARGRSEKNLILMEKMSLYSAMAVVRKKAAWPMNFVKLGALLNFLILVGGTLAPDRPLETGAVLVLLILSLRPFLVGFIWLEGLISEHIDSVLSHYEIEREALAEQQDALTQ